jgi:hypothetical protein
MTVLDEVEDVIDPPALLGLMEDNDVEPAHGGL